MNNCLSLFVQKEAKRFRLKVGVFLLLFQNDHILLLRRFQTGIDDGNYQVPAGCIDGNESLASAFIREAREEANIVLKPEDLSVCHFMHRLHPMPEGHSFEQMDAFFRAQHYTGEIQIGEPHKCDELKFFPLEELPTNLSPFIRHAIYQMKAGLTFSEFGW